MECKVFTGYFCTVWIKYWNISRMECKVTNAEFDLIANSIGIYPEWNVKHIIKLPQIPKLSLEYIQNGM